jgi:RbcX protein
MPCCPALTHGRSFFGSSARFCARARRSRVSPRLLTVRVQANELNQWGDTSGPEENAGRPELGFEVDAAGSVCRLLTAKATQHVLQQLGETDLIVCQWLNNFAADNPPLRGDDFLLKLMAQVSLERSGSRV